MNTNGKLCEINEIKCEETTILDQNDCNISNSNRDIDS